MKLRYVGAAPTTFITGAVGAVEPGDEFTVSDELAPAFLARADVEEVVEVVEAKLSRKRPSAEEPSQSVATDGGDPEMKSEENDAVSNDR